MLRSLQPFGMRLTSPKVMQSNEQASPKTESERAASREREGEREKEGEREREREREIDAEPILYGGLHSFRV